MIAQRGAAVARARAEAFRDQRGLRAIQPGVEDGEREHDGQDEERRHPGIHQQEVGEGKGGHEDAAEQVPTPPPKAVGQIAEERDREELQHGGNGDRVQNEPPAQVQLLHAIGHHKDGEDVERGLLSEARACTEQNLGRAVPERRDDRGTCLALLRLHPGEERRLQDAQADIQADNDQQPAQEERDAPTPGEEARPGGSLDDVDHDGGEHQPDGYAHLRPAGPEATMALVPVFQRQQDRATPFPADAQALAEPQEHENERCDNAKGGIAGQEAD